MTGPTRQTHSSPTLIWAALVVVYLVWGSTYLAIRVVVETMPPLLSAGVRFIISGAILAAIIAIRGGVRALKVNRRQLGSAALIGILLLTGGNGLVMVSEQRVPSGLTALLIAIVPLLVVIFRASTGDRPKAATAVGVVLGLAGIAVLVLPGGQTDAPVLWLLLVLVAAISWASGTFLSPRLALPDNPFVASTYEMLFGAAALVIFGVARGEAADVSLADTSTSSWIALLYLITAGSLAGFTAYVWLLHHAPLSLVATYAYVNPIVAVGLGALLLGEKITVSVLLGGGIIIVAVALVVATERPSRTRKSGISEKEHEAITPTAEPAIVGTDSSEQR